MSIIPFGQHVSLTAIVRPVYLTWSRRREVARPDDWAGNIFAPAEYEDLPEPVLVNNTQMEPDAELGLPLPDSPEVPPNGVHRRLRRFPGEVHGIVVGRVLRKEGQYHERSGGGHDPYTGDYDYEQAHLSPARSVWLYEVAVSTFDGRHAAPSRIVLAHPDDMAEGAA